MDQDGFELHDAQKYSTNIQLSWPNKLGYAIKQLFYGVSGSGKIFPVGQRVIPSGQDSAILPARVANHSTGFGSSCPLTELAI